MKYVFFAIACMAAAIIINQFINVNVSSQVQEIHGRYTKIGSIRAGDCRAIVWESK